jgi:beta-galactosidase
MPKTILLTLLLLLTLSAQAQTGEQQLSLNGRWLFKTDPYGVGEKQQWFSPDYAAAGWEGMTVPGNWDTHNHHAHYVGKGWYRRQVEVPADWQGQRIKLNFEAVYHDAKVWLNGQYLGESNSGFFPFGFDVTDQVRPGGQNTVVVQADNTHRVGAIWNWGGIRRPVSLVATPTTSIEQAQVRATPDLVSGTAQVRVQVGLRNDSNQPQTLSCTVALAPAGAAGAKGKTLSQTVTLPARSAREITLQTQLPKAQVHLWHFDDPFLYQAQVSLRQGNTLRHQRTERFGIRKIEVDGLQVKLNGEAVRLMGFNWVPDDRTTGNTLPTWRIREDIDLMKQAGANMARLSHLPLPKEAIDYLDEKGMLVFSEIPLWGKDPLVDPDHPRPKEWLRQLVQGQYNHPSVIGWCVGNEIGFVRDNPKVMAYVASAIRFVKEELDDSRLVVYVSHSADAQEQDPVQFSDMILFNKYGQHGARADEAHRRHPGKPLFYAEYGQNLTSENLNQGVSDAKGMLDDMRGRDYLMGACLWTFNDYRSNWQAHAAWNTAPTENRAWGAVNVFRQPKRAYAAFRRENAPIRGFAIRQPGELRPGTRVSSTVTIRPRGRLDLPAYPLRNYKLVWELQDGEGKPVQGGFTPLPEIRPGGNIPAQQLTWTVPAQPPGAINYSLLSPTGYAVYDTTVYLQKPKAPRVEAVIPGPNSVRLVFARDPMAEAYVVRYGSSDFSSRSDTTINHYVDIPKLENGQTYQFQLLGLNPLGEGEPSQTVKASPAADLLPPVIWAVEAADSSFFIGHGYENFDYLYTVRYGTDLKNPERWQTQQATTKGVTRIPNLPNGQPVFFQLKRTVQQYVESNWSEVRTVTPDGQQPPPVPVVNGVYRNGREAIVSFQPVPKATGYVLRYEENGREKTLNFNGSGLAYAVVQGLQPNKQYSFKLSAVSAYGESAGAAAGADSLTQK